MWWDLTLPIVFYDVVQLTLRESGYLGGSHLITESFLWLVSSDTECRFQGWAGFSVLLLPWLWRMPLEGTWTRVTSGSQLTASKEARISVLHPQGSEFCKQFRMSLKQMLPRDPQRRAAWAIPWFRAYKTLSMKCSWPFNDPTHLTYRTVSW